MSSNPLVLQAQQLHRWAISGNAVLLQRCAGCSALPCAAYDILTALRFKRPRTLNPPVRSSPPAPLDSAFDPTPWTSIYDYFQAGVSSDHFLLDHRLMFRHIAPPYRSLPNGWIARLPACGLRPTHSTHLGQNERANRMPSHLISKSYHLISEVTLRRLCREGRQSQIEVPDGRMRRRSW